MTWAALDSRNILLILCAVFYAVLCIFSIVTGIMYMSGKRELNPIELPDSFVEGLSDRAKRASFAKKMGLLTFVVGIVQDLTSYAILRGGSPGYYWLALGFTVFSICSVAFKLKGKVNAFPLLKLVCYLAILIVLVLGSTRALFF